jgi:hypothetical protein
MIVLVDILACGKPEHFCFIQFPVSIVLNALNRGMRHCKMGVLDIASELAALTFVPFRIDHQTEAFLKGEAPVLFLIRKLLYESDGQSAEPHLFQGFNSRLVNQ